MAHLTVFIVCFIATTISKPAEENSLKNVLEKAIEGSRVSDDNNGSNFPTEPFNRPNADVVKAFLEFLTNSNVNKASTIPNYEQPNRPCSTTQPVIITDETGVIYSPGFKKKTYYDGLVCSWKFQTVPGKVVKIKVLVMELEVSDYCEYDSLQIFDVINDQEISLGKYCGHTLPLEFLQSTGQTMSVYFVTDVTENNGRFSFQYDFVDPKPPEPFNPICGIPYVRPNISQIVGGDPAVPYSWPWQISLQRTINGVLNHICGGSIVSTNVVLTAAHCLFSEDFQPVKRTDFTVVAGGYSIIMDDDRVIRSEVKELIIHDDYDPRYTNSTHDIAGIILETPFQYNDRILPICIPRQNPSLNSICYASGWGTTQGTGDETILNQVRLPIVSQGVCALDEYDGLSGVHDSQICAGYEIGGKDTCGGDSGGPLACYNAVNERWYLQGITSFGPGCGNAKKPGVYTRTNSFLCWIYEKTGGGIL